MRVTVKEETNVFGITIGGKPQASEKFISSITILFGGKKPGPGTPKGSMVQLINLILELLVANDILKPQDAANLAITFGMIVLFWSIMDPSYGFWSFIGLRLSMNFGPYP